MRSAELVTTPKDIQRKRNSDLIFVILGWLSLAFILLTLLILVTDLAITGVPRINAQFLSSFPSRFADKAGILSAWVGSLYVMLTTALSAIPLGIAAGVYLEEYSRKNFITAFIELNIINLAAIPSIIFGLMALGIFIYRFNLGHSVLTAGLTLGLLVLPIIIVTTRESLRAIPGSIREAAAALGATKWQICWHHLLPYSTGGILTGVIMALSRAVGETAPLITVGALTFIAFLPDSPIISEPPFLSFAWLKSDFTVLPIQMFNWISRPQSEFHINAAATGIILLLLTLTMNSLAIYLRYRFRKKTRW